MVIGTSRYLHLAPLSHTIYKNYSKWVKGLHVRAKTIKPIEENKDVNVHDLGLQNGFLYMTPKA